MRASRQQELIVSESAGRKHQKSVRDPNILKDAGTLVNEAHEHLRKFRVKIDGNSDFSNQTAHRFVPISRSSRLIDGAKLEKSAKFDVTESKGLTERGELKRGIVEISKARSKRRRGKRGSSR